MLPSNFAQRATRVRFSNNGLRQYHHLSFNSPRRPNVLRLPHTGTSRRHASSSASEASSIVTRMKNFAFGTSIILGAILGYFYITDTRSSVHRYVLVPMLRMVVTDPEDAHHFGTYTLKALYQFGLHPRERSDPDEAGDLSSSVFGHTLANPIGTSGGLDKDAEVPNPLFALGPGIVEVGGCTPKPQEGNPKPRVFRIPSQNAIINRYGLNSQGADHMATVLRFRVREFADSIGYGHDAAAEQRILDGEANVPPGSLMPGRLMAVQIAKNKTTPETDVEAVKADYVYCVDRLAKYADILVVNVSSPNTPGLRSLQATGPLTEILKGVVGAAKKADRKRAPAVMVKVSPDEDSDEQIAGICEAVYESGVDGVIVGNTTKKRPNPLPIGYKLDPVEEQVLLEQGGYSGPQLFDQTVKLVKKYRTLLDMRQASTSSPGSTSARKEQAAETPSGGKSLTLQGAAQSGTLQEKADDSIGKIAETIETQTIPLRDISDLPSSEKQSLFQLPDRHKEDGPAPNSPGNPASASPNTYLTTPPTSETAPRPEAPKAYDTPKAAAASPRGLPATSAGKASSILPSSSEETQKIIFATGGITNGKQALEVLNAGASVAMIYTALVYGGVGTISRIKGEMRDEIKTGSKA